MSFLERIRPVKAAEADRLRAEYALRPPVRPDHLPVRDFHGALAAGGGLIAEIKHRSPSNPTFRLDTPPGRMAAIYRRHGAAALSIVTDEANFGTSLADVPSLHAAADLPVITKDFIIDPVQVQAAWAAGADAVLLIARMLDGPLLEQLMAAVRSLGLDALVECHDADDIAMAVAAGARLIGVNNRNLATLTTDLEYGGRLLPAIPANVVRISESGLNTRADILKMAALGADAFLVGHALLLDRDPGRKVGELCGRFAEHGTRVKVCGLTNAEDAAAADRAGADILGIIFAQSPRRIGLPQAAAIRQALPAARLCGVFMDQDLTVVAAEAIEVGLDLIQLHGAESPAYCEELAALTGLPLIKALRPAEAGAAFVEAYAAVAYFLVDLPKDRPADAAGAAAAARAAALIGEHGREVFLAGALTPANVAAAVAAATPYGVDVCGGVEKAKGIKHPDLVRQFIEETRT